MQYSILLTAATALIASSAAAVLPRTGASQDFNVIDFYASGARFSISTTYRFNVTDGFTSADCFASVSTLPEISYVPVTCCRGPQGCDWQFSFSGTEGGYNLNITNTSPPTIEGYREEAIKFFPSSAVKTQVDPTDPNGNYDYLDTAPDFVIGYTEIPLES